MSYLTKTIKKILNCDTATALNIEDVMHTDFAVDASALSMPALKRLIKQANKVYQILKNNGFYE